MLKQLWHYLFGNPNESILKDEDPNIVKYLIVGLGNIGEKYNKTRHNIGFDVADALVESLGGEFKPERYGAVAVCKHKGRAYIVLKPSTFMNLSGQAVRYWLNKEKLSPENMMVIVDDLNIDFGVVRIKAKGGAGGHNGLKSIEEELGHSKYPRLRFGIGDQYSKGAQVNFVLGKWSPAEAEKLPKVIKHSVGALKSFGFIGLARTMNQFNKKVIQMDPPSSPKEDENPDDIADY